MNKYHRMRIRSLTCCRGRCGRCAGRVPITIVIAVPVRIAAGGLRVRTAARMAQRTVGNRSGQRGGAHHQFAGQLIDAIRGAGVQQAAASIVRQMGEVRAVGQRELGDDVADGGRRSRRRGADGRCGGGDVADDEWQEQCGEEQRQRRRPQS